MGDPSSSTEGNLREYTRMLRNAQSGRKAYSEDSQNTIRKQRMNIEAVKKENEQLREEVSILTKNKSNRETVEMAKRNNQLNSQHNTLARKLAEENRHRDDLNRQIKILAAKINVLISTERRGVYHAQESDQAVYKQISMLENRLDKALVKFNEALSKNRELREEIENLRQERKVFDEIYKRLEHDLHEKKKEMAAVIEDSNVAYEERDQAQAELVALREQYERENAELDHQFEAIDLELEKDRRRKAKLRMREGAATPAHGPGSPDADDAGQGVPARGQWNEAVEMASQEVAREKADQYEDAIQKIKTATGLNDLETIVQKFIQAEEQNFSLFNYVNDLNNEIEKLEEQVAEMKQEKELIHGQGASASSQHEQIIAELESKLNVANDKAELYQQQHDEALQTLEGLRAGIDSLFHRIGCELGPIAEVLGDSGVTESNMMQYLGIIEQRANELLQLYASIQGPELSAELGSTSQSIIGAAVFGMGPQTPFGSSVLDVRPPAAGDEMDGDESEFDDVRPLTREELMAKLAESRRSLGASGGGSGKKGKRASASSSNRPGSRTSFDR